MTSYSQTTTTHAQWIPEVWASAAQKAVEFDQVLNSRCNHEYEGDLKNWGDLVNITTLSNLTAQTKSSGYTNTAQYDVITETVQQVQVTSHYYSAFLTEHPPEVQSKYSFDQYTGTIGYALNRKMETDISALFASYSVYTGTLGSEPTDDDILYCWQKLGEAGTPEGDRSMFLTYASYAALLKMDKFINRQYVTTGSAVEKAKVGNIYGMDVYISNLLTSNGAGYDCAVQHKQQVISIQQLKPKVMRTWDPDFLGWKVTADILYKAAETDRPPETAGGGAVVDTWGVWLKAA